MFLHVEMDEGTLVRVSAWGIYPIVLMIMVIALMIMAIVLTVMVIVHGAQADNEP